LFVFERNVVYYANRTKHKNLHRTPEHVRYTKHIALQPDMQ